jgi:hypothetical protein
MGVSEKAFASQASADEQKNLNLRAKLNKDRNKQTA